MSINHHPDDATLLSYAAGSLPESFEILVGCHIESCARCQARVAEAESLGAALVELMPTTQMDNNRDRFLALLDQEIVTESEAKGLERTQRIPAELRQLLDHGDEQLEWKRLVPGIQQIRLDTQDGRLRLLKIAPGISIPLHTHAGSELTMILQGSYSDEIGRFCKGDVSDLDPDIEHQPITDGAAPCICLVATDAPLRFRGLLPKLLQPFTGF